MTYESVCAGIRATIAANAQAQDDGRTDDIVALFTPNGVVEIPGFGPLEGAEAIRKAFNEWKPRVPQRHMVTNTIVTQWDDTAAKADSDVVQLVLGDAGWAVQIVARYHDTFEYSDGTWLLSHRSSDIIGAAD